MVNNSSANPPVNMKASITTTTTDNGIAARADDLPYMGQELQQQQHQVGTQGMMGRSAVTDDVQTLYPFRGKYVTSKH